MNRYVPDCRRLKSSISVSSSISWGGWREAERAEGPFGTVTAKSDIDEDGVESTDFNGTFDDGCSFDGFDATVSDLSIWSATSTSDAPLPVASGMLFKRLMDDAECLCFLEPEGIVRRDGSIFTESGPLFSCITWSLGSSLSETFGEIWKIINLDNR